jgi:hypothetical protein
MVSIGFTPFAMLWQPDHPRRRSRPAPEWRAFQRRGRVRRSSMLTRPVPQPEPVWIRELAESLDFAIDVTEPRDVRLRRFESLIEAHVPDSLSPWQPGAEFDFASLRDVLCSVSQIFGGWRGDECWSQFDESVAQQVVAIQRQIESRLLAASHPDGEARQETTNGTL